MGTVPKPHINPMRIAMLCLHSSPLGPLGTRDTGGMSVYVRETAREMARYGHRIDIYTYVPCSAAITHLHRDVRLIELDHNEKKAIPKEELIDHLPEMIRALEQFTSRHNLSYDLLHSHYWISGCAGDAVSKSWASPHLITFHTLGRVKNLTTKGENEPDVRIAHEDRLVDSADAVVAPSDGERHHLLKRYGAASGKVHVIPCGVNMAQFQPADRDQARTELNIDPDAAVLLFVGRFAPVKGMPALLSAVAELAKRQIPLRLVVVGGDGQTAEATVALKKQAEGLGIAPLVQLTGRVDHSRLPLYYAAADVLVLPSTYESFGLVTLEALACGTPVVATRVGGAAAVLKDGVNGILIDRPEGNALAGGIERTLTQVRRGELTAQRIRESIAPYSWDRVAAATLKLYRNLIGALDIN